MKDYPRPDPDPGSHSGAYDAFQPRWIGALPDPVVSLDPAVSVRLGRRSSVDVALQERLAAQAAEVQAAELEAAVQERLALIAAFGEDDYGPGQAIRFIRTLPGPRGVLRDYTYLALKTDDGWYITGTVKNPGKLNWQGLLQFLVSGEVPTRQFEVLAHVAWVGATSPQAPPVTSPTRVVGGAHDGQSACSVRCDACIEDGLQT